MILPTAVRSGFILSGFLQIFFDGIPNGNGGTTSLETIVPFKVVCRNQSRPSNGVKLLMRPLLKEVGNSKPAQPTKNPIRMMKAGVNLVPKQGEEENSIMNSASTPSTPTLMMPEPLPSSSSEVMTPSNKVIDKCGQSQCNEDEMCVSWKNVDKMENMASTYSKRSPKNTDVKIFSECQKNNGLYHPKVNPIMAAQLCPPGLTHALQRRPQSCLRDDPPCPLIWDYKCVEESASPHNCTLKTCPPGGCVEQIICSDQPPCMLEAVCLHGLLR